MNTKRTPESSLPAGRALLRPALVAAIFLALHTIPLVWRPDPSWGVDFLYFLPAPVQGLFVLLSALLFVPGVRRSIRACANALPFALLGRGPRVRISRFLVILIALAGFVLLSTARHFLGDGYPVLGNLEAGFWSEAPRAPLSWALIRALHDVCQPYLDTAENTYRIYSYASGVLYVLLAFPVAACIGKTNRDKTIVCAFLFTAGYIQLFFGYVEHYPLFMPGLLLYLLLGLQTLKQRLTLFAPASVLGVLIALHTAFTVFAPSLAFLAYRAFRQQQDVIASWKNAFTNIAALCCVPVTAALFVGLSGIGFEAYVSRMGGRNFLPLFAEPGYLSQYRIFSPAHILDFLNQQMLAAPAVCMSIFLVGGKAFTNRPFLTVCAFVPLLFTFVANPEIGAFRDWDAFSLPALPLTLWTAAAFVDGKKAGKSRFDTAFVLCGAAALHTFAWIGVNASASAAQARFIQLADRLSGNAGVNSWMILGAFHETRKNDAAALQAYKRALDVDPTNSNRWLTIGVFYRERQQFARAIEYFKKAQELQPDLAMPYMNLGAAYSDIRQFDRAIDYTLKAIALDPDLASAQMNLGSIYRKSGQPDKAIQHLEKAAALRPGNGAAHGHLGMAYRDLGNIAKAVEHLQEAHALRPRHTETIVNLAVACSDAGQYDRAVELLKRAAELKPGLAAIHVNLGAVYGRTDQYGKAIRHLSRARELQPDNPETYKNLGLIYKAQGRYPEAIGQFGKVRELQSGRPNLQNHLNLGDTYFAMGRHEEAIPHYRKALQLNPSHANAHLLLGLSYRALNRNDEARTHLERVLELEPQHSHAARIKQWLGRAREGR